MQNGFFPLFAPAGQQRGYTNHDDIDLNEIFAEYFINEFDDPLNAYTGSMANYGGAVNSVASSLNPSMNMFGGGGIGGNTGGGLNLPTGGIRTAFHTGAISEPDSKKLKSEPSQQQQAVAAPLVLSVAPQDASGMGALQSASGSMLAQQQMIQGSSAQGISLPVGVGIRLGGPGGIAPATAQNAQRVAGAQGQLVFGAPNSGVQEHSLTERRQRNREHAKRSRVRKKFMLESLQAEVRQLQRENQDLRMIVQENLPDKALDILSECSSPNPVFADLSSSEDYSAEQKKNVESLTRADFTLMQSLTSGQKCFVLSDPKLPDNPIVFASPGFYKLTGYTSKEVLGRNCRFLQGPGTNPKAVDVIRKAIATGSDASLCLLNYKADGTPFWNQFFIAALRDSDNCVVNYVGVQCEVEPEGAVSALEEKVNAVHPLQPGDRKDDDYDDEDGDDD